MMMKLIIAIDEDKKNDHVSLIYSKDVFARKNALQAHIRAKTSVEPLFKCDKLNEVTRQPCGYTTNYSSAFKRHIKRHEHKIKNLLLGRIGGTKDKGLGQYITDMNPKTQPGTSKTAAAATTTTKKITVTANKSMMKLITTKTTTRISRSTAAKINTVPTIVSSSSSEDNVSIKVKKNIKPLVFSSSTSTSSSSSEQSIIVKPKRNIRKLPSSSSSDSD
ncbi:hypothetical protein PVAND_007803 [Polypedilum vanderplanki]|uniref:Uncharacterized protein n=1 Tax=Polypedilum vanderplanki TaxID=319348 RepID=A0A9J6C8X9_POLVA|nr:hypothetical protein PVAND_007803 [Polypedilum vanderplanki]